MSTLFYLYATGIFFVYIFDLVFLSEKNKSFQFRAWCNGISLVMTFIQFVWRWLLTFYFLYNFTSVSWQIMQQKKKYIHICLHFSFLVLFTGLSTLVKRLDALNYSTVYYMFDGNNIRDFGSNCDMAHQLSMAYAKQIIFWPCPQMKVSNLNVYFFFKCPVYLFIFVLGFFKKKSMKF